MGSRVRRVGDGLAGLAGARPDLLEAAPSARPRFVALGGVLLSTGGLAVVSAAFALHMAVGVWWPLALVLGLGWGVVIVNLDRMLVVGMSHDASVRRNLLMAVPRVGLALVLGTVIATPLTLQVFHREIDTAVVTLQAEQADAYKKHLDGDARFRGMPALQRQVTAEQAVVASGGQADPDLKAVQDDVAAKQTAYAQALTSYQALDAQAQCELNGTCGTGTPGTGTAYETAKAAAGIQAAVVAAAKADLDAGTAALTAARTRSVQQATAGLATDQATLTSLTRERDRLQAAFDASNSRDDGILIRLQALSRLADANAMLGAARTMLELLFICIELLPVLTKVLLNFGPPTAYDRLAALRDRTDVEIEAVQQDARTVVEQSRVELMIMDQQERLDRQKEAVQARRREAEAAEARVEARFRAREERFRAEQERAQARAQVEQELLAEAEENARRPWDTGPIFTAARNAAARTVRSVTRRSTERESLAV